MSTTGPSEPGSPDHGRGVVPDLLLACLRRPWSSDSVRAGAASHALDWDQSLRLARQHHVLALAAQALTACAVDLLPDSRREELEAYLAALRLRNTYMAGELLAVLRTFDDAGIMPVPFKGPVLAQTLYGDAGLREFGDLDLLIATADVAHAKRLLVSREYTLDPAVRGDLRSYVLGLPPERAAAYLRSRSEHHFMRSSDNMTVDLHLALADSYIRFPLSFRELCRRSEWVPLGDSCVRNLAPEDTLLVLALNGAKDGWERLQRTCDVAALLRARPELDWRSTFVRARRLGGLRLLRVSLLLARDILGAPLPPGVSCDLDADDAAQVLARNVAARLFVERERAPVLTWQYARSYVRTRERLRDRVWFFLDLALRPTVADWRAMPLSLRMSWLYYVTRPLRLAFTYGSVRRARGPR